MSEGFVWELEGHVAEGVFVEFVFPSGDVKFKDCGTASFLHFDEVAEDELADNFVEDGKM